KISGDLGACLVFIIFFVFVFILAGDGYVAAIVEGFFDHGADIRFGGELRNASLKIFAFESGDDFEFVARVRVRQRRRSEALRGVGRGGIVPMFSAAHTRLASSWACGAA